MAKKSRTAKKQQRAIHIIKQERRKGSGSKPEHCIGRGIQLLQIRKGKPVHTNIDDELQPVLKENNLSPDQGIHKEKNVKEPQKSDRRSNRLPFAKQTGTSRERPKSAPYLRLKIEKGGPFGLCETPAGCKK